MTAVMLDEVYGTGNINSFFFKQKTAYEILSGLVGSGMCIRDRAKREASDVIFHDCHSNLILSKVRLLYSSDAADEGLGVDLGGRRIIKKKNTNANLFFPYDIHGQ